MLYAITVQCEDQKEIETEATSEHFSEYLLYLLISALLYDEYLHQLVA